MTRCRRWLVAWLLLLVGVSSAAAQGSGRTLVMPFENVAGDSRILWLREASAVLLADDLIALGAGAITREERRAAFERLQVPPAAALTDATVIRLGQLLRASQVVVGTLRLENDELVVQAKSIALEPGRVQNTVIERGAIPELFATFERMARGLLNASELGTQSQITHPPVAAFESYIKGLVAETTPTAINYLNAALKTDPTFDRARLALWDVFTEQDDHQRALAAVQAVPKESSLRPRALFLAGLSQLSLQQHAEAFAMFKVLSEERPNASVFNNLGVVQLRRGGGSQVSGRATSYFKQATDIDGSDPDLFFNLGYSCWLERDTQAAIYWLREAVRRNPADGDAHFVLGAALAAAGQSGEAAREKELARRLSSTYEQWDRRPAAEAVPRGLERVKAAVELPHPRLAEATAGGAQRDQRDLAKFYLDRGRRLFQEEKDREAIDELNRALYLSPYEAEAHLLVGRIHLRAGRPHDAIDALKISLWSAETAEAHAALARAFLETKNTTAARDEATKALALDAQSVEAKQVLDRANGGQF